jgi:hypothetical protein
MRWSLALFYFFLSDFYGALVFSILTVQFCVAFIQISYQFHEQELVVCYFHGNKFVAETLFSVILG